MGLSSLLLVAAAALPGQALPDRELAQHRAGFALPGGLDVSLVVQSDTKVDGTLVLRSVYRANEGMPSLTVFAPDAGTVVEPSSSATSSSPRATSAGGVDVTFDRQNGVMIGTRAAAAPTVTVGNISNDGLGAAPDGSSAIAVVKDGGAVAVPGGQLSVSSLPGGSRVRLEGDRLDVSHLVGDALGSVIANSGSDRAIDTMTTVGIDINGASPANLGSSMMRIEGLALESAVQLAPR